MAKRFSTVSTCPWCGSVPPVSATVCSCGVVLPKCSDFEFGVRYADASKDDVRSKFGNLCQSAVDGEETAVKEILLGNSGLCDAEAWAKEPDGLKIISEVADKGFKWGKYCLGYFFFHGVASLKKDISLAKSLMLSAGRTKEDPITCSRAFQHLCMCRFDGVGGFDRDVDKAMYWLLKLRNSSIALYYKTVCEILNRTDLCAKSAFVTGSTVEGWPTDWKVQRKLVKSVFKKPKEYLDCWERRNNEVDLFTFGPQMDMRQFNCLMEEATNNFKKKNSKTPFEKLRELPSRCCFPRRGDLAYTTSREKDDDACLCFRDFKYWDNVVLDTSIPVDHLLFGDISRYCEMLSEATYTYKNSGGYISHPNVFLSHHVELIESYFRFVRRYILSDRKGGVRLWDGSTQSAVNASSLNIKVD